MSVAAACAECERPASDGAAGPLRAVGSSCAHAVCARCATELLVDAASRAPARVLAARVECPAVPCGGHFSREAADAALKDEPETRAALEALRSTVPRRVRAASLAEFGYRYAGDDGRLETLRGGRPFRFLTQRHYDALGDAAIAEVQRRMREEHGMRELWFPLAPPPAGAEAAAAGPDAEADARGARRPGVAQSNVFLSEGALEHEGPLLVLVQGMGAVRAGLWARALILNDSLELGSVLPYLARAREAGYAVAVLNPNLGVAPVGGDSGDDGGDEAAAAAAEREDPDAAAAYYLSEKRHDARPRRREAAVEGSETSDAHALYAWDELLSRARASDILVVAHSAGGPNVLRLMRERPAVLERLRAVAFTDSFVSPARGPPGYDELLREGCVNYAASREPLGTPLGGPSARCGCPRVSAGHAKHAFTSASAIGPVFAQLGARLAAAAAAAEDA